MTVQSLRDLLVRELQGIRDAEEQAFQMLQQQVEQVENTQLRKVLGRRMVQGERLRLEVRRGLQKLGSQERSERDGAARGIIEHARKTLDAFPDPEMKQIV